MISIFEDMNFKREEESANKIPFLGISFNRINMRNLKTHFKINNGDKTVLIRY